MRHPILVVDNRRSTRDALVQVLDDEGFVGIPAATDREALDYLRTGGRASVILHNWMASEAGESPFRRAQQADPILAKIPVIALSPLENRPVSGRTGHPALPRPIDFDALLLIVRRLCWDEAPRILQMAG